MLGQTCREKVADVRFPAERFRLLTESYDLQKTEVSQMSKRNLELQQMLAKRDMAMHKVSLPCQLVITG